MNDMQYGRWSIRWSGWREPSNQIILFGFWLAHQPDNEAENIVISTTGGVIQDLRFESEAIDTSFDRDLPPVVITTPERVRQEYMLRAFDALITHLDRRSKEQPTV